MPRVSVKKPSADEIRSYAREFGIVTQHAKSNADVLEVDPQSLIKHVESDHLAEDAASVKNVLTSGDVEFSTLAKTLKKASTAIEGDGNCFGYAAFDEAAEFRPYRFNRRSVGEDDILIKIAYAGICHSDWHTVTGDWGKPKYPIIPGHEIVGVVTEVGPHVTKFKVGDLAGVGCTVNSCRNCQKCATNRDNYCSKAIFTYNSEDVDGTTTQGGYSTHVVVDNRYAMHIPANLPFHAVAPLLCAGVTMYSPIRYFGLDKPGMKVAVNGLGGLGHMAVKFLVSLGVEVTVISRNRSKEEAARKLGAHHYLVASDTEAVKAVEGTLNGILDTVSAKHDFDFLLKLLDEGGKLVIVGLPPDQMTLNHFPLVLRRLTVAGSVIGSIAENQEMLDFCGERGIVPDVEMIDIDQVNEAMVRLVKGDVKFRFVINVQKSLIL